MKIWCDVCNKEEAKVFCSADEAALCEVCDRRVHHANKLAREHIRFSLLNPNFKESPLCDICQEGRAFLFCQEDRAILCRECDLPIHAANEKTQKHNRFLLTGAKLCSSSSSSSSSSSPPSVLMNQASSCSNGHGATIDDSSQSSKRFCSVSNNPGKPISREDSDNASISTSSISEYLMETLPGWRVDDFFEPSSSSANNGFYF